MSTVMLVVWCFCYFNKYLSIKKELHIKSEQLVYTFYSYHFTFDADSKIMRADQ